MHCNKCGAKLNENDKICSYCGSLVSEKQDVINSNQNHSNNENYTISKGKVKKTKKKPYWLIPVSLFCIGCLLMILIVVINVIIKANEMNNSFLIFIKEVLGAISTIALLAVIPSIIVAIVLSNKQSKNIQNVSDNSNNNINSESFQNLEEKMECAYIGKNYDKIKNNKFNFSAWFFSFFYILYRKMYIQGSLLFLGISGLSFFLSSEVSTILVSALLILIGFMFNGIYMNYVKKQVNLIRKNNPNCSEEKLIDICKSKGGTNIFIAIAISVVLSTITSTIYYISTYQQVNTIQENVGDENNGYVLEYSLPQSFEKSTLFDDADERVYYLKSNDIDDTNDKLCSISFDYEDYEDYEDYDSASDFITSWYCVNNATSCDIKSININSNTWYYIEKEEAYEKSSIYVCNDENKLYRVIFTIPNDSSEKQKCSDYRQSIIKSLKFVKTIENK